MNLETTYELLINNTKSGSWTAGLPAHAVLTGEAAFLGAAAFLVVFLAAFLVVFLAAAFFTRLGAAFLAAVFLGATFLGAVLAKW